MKEGRGGQSESGSIHVPTPHTSLAGRLSKLLKVYISRRDLNTG